MLTGLTALDDTDWKKLYHAYGPATDTPGHLRALLGSDAKAREKALEHLRQAVIHQGTLYPVTGPAALVVVGLLADAKVDHDESLRANLLGFLVAVSAALDHVDVSVDALQRMAAFDVGPFLETEEAYEDLSENEEAMESFYAGAALGCISAAPVMMDVLLRELSGSSAMSRAYAGMGAVKLAKLESLRHHAVPIEWQLLSLAHDAPGTDERSAHVLSLGELGYAPATFLSDASPAVRMCAALAPGLAGDPHALKELLTALEAHAGDIDGWFVEKPPQFAMRPRFQVVQRLVHEVRDFNRLVNAAIAVSRVTLKGCVDHEWGPLLAAAFPQRNGIIETDAQCRYLRALVENADLWDPRFGNASVRFKELGLPYERNACARLVLEGPVQQT